MYRRLMGSVDPDLVITAEPALRDVDGARDVGQVRMRMDRPHTARRGMNPGNPPGSGIGHSRIPGAQHRLLDGRSGTRAGNRRRRPAGRTGLHRG